MNNEKIWRHVYKDLEELTMINKELARQAANKAIGIYDDKNWKVVSNYHKIEECLTELRLLFMENDDLMRS